MECIYGKSASVIELLSVENLPQNLGVLQFSSAQKNPNLATDISRRKRITSQNICSAAGRRRRKEGKKQKKKKSVLLHHEKYWVLEQTEFCYSQAYEGDSCEACFVTHRHV